MIHTYKKITPSFTTNVMSKELLTLKRLQEYVGGDIQIIALPDNMLMVVNENGLSEDLTHNTIASNIANNFIVGTVLICDMDSID